jgi:hypothetical protein
MHEATADRLSGPILKGYDLENSIDACDNLTVVWR